MKAVRIFFMVLGAVWVIGVIAIGMGGTYLQHNPEKAIAYAAAAASVDRDAPLIDQAGEMADNYGNAHALIQDAQSAENGYRAHRQREAAAAEGWGGGAVANGGWAAESATGFAE